MNSIKMKNNKKLCVVGAGKWGSNHIKTLDSMGALGGIVEKNVTSSKKIKDLYPLSKVFNNLSEAIGQDFDGYVVATPPSTHFEVAKTIINSRKPVLVEKPLALNYESAFELNELAKRKKVLLMVGHILLFHSGFNKMKEIIDSGKIGDVQYIYSNRLNLGTFRDDENVFWSFAPHDISLFNYFFGKEPSKLTSRGLDILQKGIHDTTITTLEYNNKKMGHIFVSWLHPFKEHRFVIVGSNGMLHFEDSLENKPLKFYDKKAEFVDSVFKPSSGDVTSIKYPKTEPLKNELQYFISNLDKNKVKIANGDSAVNVIKILEQATKSLKKNSES